MLKQLKVQVCVYILLDFFNSLEQLKEQAGSLLKGKRVFFLLLSLAVVAAAAAVVAPSPPAYWIQESDSRVLPALLL